MFRLCWHKWSNWSKPFDWGFDWYQNKTCAKCGKMKQRRVGYSPDTEFVYPVFDEEE